MKAELKEFAEIILAGIDRFEASMNNRFEGVENRLVSVEKRLSAVEETVDDMREELQGGLKAIDTHAVTLIGHGKRIGRLEKRIA